MKVRILIWAVTGLIVAGAVVLLATNKNVPGGVEPDFGREDLIAFSGRMESRLASFERRYGRIRDSVVASPDADSARAVIDRKLVECRAMLDSLAVTQDIDAGVKLKDRLELDYRSAKDWLRRLEVVGGTENEDTGEPGN
jgi:hypothetical protein